MKKKAQSVIGYAILFTAIMIAFIAIMPYIRNMLSAKWRQAGDVVGGGAVYAPGVTDTSGSSVHDASYSEPGALTLDSSTAGTTPPGGGATPEYELQCCCIWIPCEGNIPPGSGVCYPVFPIAEESDCSRAICAEAMRGGVPEGPGGEICTVAWIKTMDGEWLHPVP